MAGYQNSGARDSGFCREYIMAWSRERRVVGKAEHLAKGATPRFIVTSLSSADYQGGYLYEKIYCARGDMENRIKEQQLMLFAARTGTSRIHSNQVRLYFSSIAYVLLQTLRRIVLTGTSMSKAQCCTIRMKLLKTGAQVRITVRKVWIAFAEGCPYREIFMQALAINRLPARSCFF